MSEIIEAEIREAPAILELRPKQMIERATEVANVLRDVIKEQDLSVKIGPSEHVKADGWALLGSLMQILPKESRVIEHEDGSYEAFVDLVNMKTGMVVGGGSALCGMDEARWKKADRYARRSMAITRATGKAYRLCFAWVMALAGYSPTPAEEMPWDNKPDAAPKASTPVSNVYDGKTIEQKKTLAAVMDNYQVPQDKKVDVHRALINWKVKYPDWLDSGVQTCMDHITKGEEIPAEIPF